jgi:hypothetical protein
MEKAVPVVVRILRARGRDDPVERVCQRAVIGVDLGRRRAENQVRVEVGDLPGHGGGEPVALRAEPPVRQPGKHGRRHAQGASRFPRLFPPALPVGRGIAPFAALLGRPVGRDPDPDVAPPLGTESEETAGAQDLVVRMRRQNEDLFGGQVARLVGDELVFSQVRHLFTFEGV